MTAMPTMRNIANATPANATDVDWNFETIETHVGNQLINRDGSVSMAAELLLAGSPSSNLGAAPKQYVDSLLPAGMVVPFAGSAAPTGWLLADGSVVSQATYAALFAVCGTTYNTGGEGAGNFRLPNLKTRTPVGRDSGAAPFQTLGSTGGSKDAVVIGHSHTVQAHSHTIDHDHPSGTTGFVSNDHTHGIDHDHASFATGLDGSHQHTLPLRQTATVGTDVAQQATNTGTVGSMATDAGGGGHQHTIDVPAFSGSSGGISANHTHSFDVANFGGSSGVASPATDTQGTTGTNLNLSPYLIVNYIIKT